MTDDEFLQGFEDTSLPEAVWTHRAHIRMAYLYVSRYPFPQALDRAREHIQAFNKAKGGPPTAYHETITHAFLQLVDVTRRVFAEKCPAANSDAFCDAHPQLMSSKTLRLFYSPERIGSPEARGRFVAPDLAPLPSVPQALAPSVEPVSNAGRAS